MKYVNKYTTSTVIQKVMFAHGGARLESPMYWNFIYKYFLHFTDEELDSKNCSTFPSFLPPKYVYKKQDISLNPNNFL